MLLMDQPPSEVPVYSGEVDVDDADDDVVAVKDVSPIWRTPMLLQ